MSVTAFRAPNSRRGQFTKAASSATLTNSETAAAANANGHPAGSVATNDTTSPFSTQRPIVARSLRPLTTCHACEVAGTPVATRTCTVSRPSSSESQVPSSPATKPTPPPSRSTHSGSIRNASSNSESSVMASLSGLWNPNWLGIPR